MEMQPVDLAQIVGEVCQQLQLHAGQVRLEISALDQATVWGNADRLKQVALILVENALRYTPAGGLVDVSLQYQGGQAVLRVSDTGIGIEAEDLAHVFERFYRADKARARDRGGTGLGLAIAQTIVERHRGSIEVESAPAAGTTFTVRLPAGAAEAQG